MVELVRRGAGAARRARDHPRGLTLTGGLPWFGGAGNNYSMHATAETVDRVRRDPGSYGFVGANGGTLSKYSVGIYSTTPTERRPDRSAELQAEIAAAWPPPITSERPTARPPSRPARSSTTAAATAPASGNGLATSPLVSVWCPRQDSNLRSRLRRAVLYPLSYGGGTGDEPNASSVITRRPGPTRRRGFPATQCKQRRFACTQSGRGAAPRCASICVIVSASAVCEATIERASATTTGTDP